MEYDKIAGLEKCGTWRMIDQILGLKNGRPKRLHFPGPVSGCLCSYIFSRPRRVRLKKAKKG